MKKRLSIIIVTYHSERDIFDCLSSIWTYCDIPKEELEVIIVDNSQESEPMFVRLRESYGDSIVLIHNTHNGGYGQGNNVGIRQSTAPVVMIMNPDVRLMQQVFSDALSEFEKRKNLCMLGMKQMLTEKIASPLSFDVTCLLNGYMVPVLSSICNKLNLYLPRWMFFSGSCFFLNKEKFEQVGLFDEDIFMYGEEDDIHWRLRQRYGCRFAYKRQLRYIHLTLDRPTKLSTEEMILKSFVIINKKRGVTEQSTVKNRLRYMRMRYVSAYCKKLMGKGNAAHIEELKRVIGSIAAKC